jgi:hypothetical protein
MQERIAAEGVDRRVLIQISYRCCGQSDHNHLHMHVCKVKKSILQKQYE